MKYSYEYKRMYVEMYRKGKWAETPDGIQKENFHKMIQGWSRIEESCVRMHCSTRIRTKYGQRKKSMSW